ncbi:C40 family peptidase [Arcicella aquatica]|uniref:C40 family peptidase n=1 Tax=Arcicella aquatica TaxID=217141 RepID=A0ABU5QQ49_9BACT|nr:C40 family peptidase [Arcicella aquatica]MEA5258814.1 C40 family peptidase [Arcicella aquatica]
MRQNHLNIFYRFFLLISLAVFLDSCKLFRRKEQDSVAARSKPVTRPANNNKVYNSKTINNIVSTARSYTGVPYRAGGADKNGMDCSGLLFCVYSQLGYKIPRISYQQSDFGKEISLDDLRPGDWVFFVTNKGNVSNINHAGMITELRSNKEVMFIHASSSKGIREDNLFTKFWMSCFAKASRPF